MGQVSILVMLSSQKAAYWSSHCTLDQQTGEHNLDKIFFTFVELPKFKALYKKEEQKLEELSLEERWYYFLIHAAQTTDEELRILSNSPEKVYAPGAGAKGGNQAMGVTKGAQYKTTSGRGCAWYAAQSNYYAR